MHIIIIGAGKVGKSLAEHLSNESHDVVIIDLNENRVEEIVDQYDVLGVTGNGATFDVLTEAGVAETDIIIAVTESDELNILAVLMAKQMGAKHCIARVRNPEYLQQRTFMRNQLGLSMIINPELETANEIRRVLLFPSAVRIDTFVGGRIEMAEFRIGANTKLAGKPLHKIAAISKSNVLLGAVSRKNDIIIPDGDFVIETNDHVFVLGLHRDLAEFCQDANLLEQEIRKVMILGGGTIAVYLAQQLNVQGIRVKILEHRHKRCVELSKKLPFATIIESDGSDEEILQEEGIDHMDAFVSLTGLDEENIVSSLYAKQLHVKKTVAKVTRMNFSSVLDELDIDSVISPKSIIAAHIVRFVRAKDNKDNDTSVRKLYKIVNDTIEAMEFVVTESTTFLNEKIRNLDLKNNVLIAAISREKGFIVPNGDTTIHLGDHIIIIAKDQRIGNLNDIVRRQ